MAGHAGIVGGATLASRVLGMLRDIALANLFARSATDAFFIAFMIPNILRRLVGEGALTVAFVPVFTDWLNRGQEAARELLRAVWWLASGVGIVLALLGILAAEPLVRLFAPGFALEPGKLALTADLLRLCFPYIAFMMLLALSMGALNAVGHFLAPAAAPVLLNVGLIAAAFAGVRGWLGIDPPILALGVAALAAGAAQVLVQLPVLARRGLAPWPPSAPTHPGVGRLLRLMGPAVLGASVFQLNLIVNRFLASFAGDGAVSYLYYADRLLELPLGVFVLALGTAALPSFSRLARAGDREAARAAFARTLNLALALAVPSAVGLIALRTELITGLFRWSPEPFTAGAVTGCAAALAAYAIGLVPITISRIYVNLCVASENTPTGARGAVVSLGTNALASLALIGPLPHGALPAALVELQHAMVLAELGYVGLALSSSIAAAANAAYVAAGAHRRYGTMLVASDLIGVARIVAAATLMGLAVLALASAFAFPAISGPRALALLALYVGSGAAVYFGALAALRAPEARTLAHLLRRP